MTYADWEKMIKQSFDLGCRSCQFIGGEPFLYRGGEGETVLELIELAKDTGYETVEIFTNGTLLTAEKVARLKELGANVAISLYSIKEEAHEAVTRTPGSFRKTMRALKMLKEAGVPTRVETVVMRTNQDTVDETVAWVEQMGFGHKHADVLRPKGRGSDAVLMPDKRMVVEKSFMTQPNFRADKDFFVRNVSGHSCLAGKVTITEFGDVLPCIFTRNLTLGNVLSESLGEIVESRELKQIWQSTKDDVLVCQDCEYRYVCFDCRPISQAVNAGRGDYLTAPYPRCTHNPYTGEWAKGVWRLDEEGKPYYDVSMQELILDVASVSHALVVPDGH